MLSTQAVEYDFPFSVPWCHHGKIACGNGDAVWLVLKLGVHLKIIVMTLQNDKKKNVWILLSGFPSLLQRHFGVTWGRSSGRSYADDASGAHLVGVCGSQNSQWAVVISVHHTRGWCLGSHSQGGRRRVLWVLLRSSFFFSVKHIQYMYLSIHHLLLEVWKLQLFPFLG